MSREMPRTLVTSSPSVPNGISDVSSQTGWSGNANLLVFRKGFPVAKTSPSAAASACPASSGKDSLQRFSR